MLKAIPIYWASVVYIPAGTMDNVRNIWFNFFWRGIENQSACPWRAWRRLYLPKDMVGWGLKYYPSFSRALATKGIWRLIYGKGFGKCSPQEIYLPLNCAKRRILQPSRGRMCNSFHAYNRLK